MKPLNYLSGIMLWNLSKENMWRQMKKFIVRNTASGSPMILVTRHTSKDFYLELQQKISLQFGQLMRWMKWQLCTNPTCQQLCIENINILSPVTKCQVHLIDDLKGNIERWILDCLQPCRMTHIKPLSLMKNFLKILRVLQELTLYFPKMLTPTSMTFLCLVGQHSLLLLVDHLVYG